MSISASFRSVMSRDGFEDSHVCLSLAAGALECGGHALLRGTDALLAPSPPFSGR